MKVLTVIGARPQFIKAAVLSRLIRDTPGINEIIVHTGQHYDSNMSDIFFKELSIPEPNYNLGVGGGSHGLMTGNQIIKIEEILLNEKPDWVIVYGDTNSTLAGALAACKLHIPIAHVEAGLRSFNKRMPEEINRILTDHMSSLLFTPTINASENLQKEGINQNLIVNVGDIMMDAVEYYSTKIKKEKSILDTLNLTSKEYYLATIHRQENTDVFSRLNEILNGFFDSGKTIVLPLHPRTQKKIQEYSITVQDNIKIIDPIGYFDMLELQKNALKVITDSGGVQKEAYFHKVPCLTLRDETEWTELIEIGVNKLVPIDKDQICKHILEEDPNLFFKENVYGDGHAGEKIINKILS